MITLTKSGNAVVFTFDENGHYLFDGAIEVPVNSLTLVTDNSQMATFRKSASNDIFISATYDELGMSKSELEDWFKTNACGSTGGGGGASGITSGEVQSMIDGSISGKANTSAVTAVDNALTAHTADTTVHVTSADKTAWNAKSDFSGSYNDLTDKPTIPTVPTSNTAFTNDAGYATSGYVDSEVSGKADIASAVTSAEYVSSSTTIEFKNAEGTVISSIDASSFVIDGMVDDVKIETISGVSYLIIDFNTASGKEDIQIPLTDIFDASNYYTKDETNAAIDAAIVAASGITSGTVETMINSAISGKADSSDVQTLSGTVTAHTADTTIHVTSAQTSRWDAKSDFSGSYNDLTDKPTIPTVPTNVSDFTNDAGYITSGEAATQIEAATSGKADTTAVTASIQAAVSGKQDTLISGTNIKTINNQSLLGEGNITISGGSGGNDVVELTQAQYDALVSGGTVDPDIFYIITDATAIDISNYYTSAQTESAINAAVSGKVNTSAVVTAVTSGSTDSEIPTAKAVFDAIPTGGTGGATYSAGTNISIDSANTISCTLPISKGTGTNSIIIGDTSKNIATGSNSFAGGSGNVLGGCTASGQNSFAFGFRNTTQGMNSVAFGEYLTTKNGDEASFGKFNISTKNETLFSVGNGTSSTNHNAFEIRNNGDIYCNNGTSDVKLQDYLQIKVVKLTQQEYDALSPNYDNNTLYIIS